MNGLVAGGLCRVARRQRYLDQVVRRIIATAGAPPVDIDVGATLGFRRNLLDDALNLCLDGGHFISETGEVVYGAAKAGFLRDFIEVARLRCYILTRPRCLRIGEGPFLGRRVWIRTRPRGFSLGQPSLVAQPRRANRVEPVLLGHEFQNSDAFPAILHTDQNAL